MKTNNFDDYRSQLKTIFLSSLGGIMEFYDFFIFLMLAKFIADDFFAGSQYARLMQTYGVFALGSLIHTLFIYALCNAKFYPPSHNAMSVPAAP